MKKRIKRKPLYLHTFDESLDKKLVIKAKKAGIAKTMYYEALLKYGLKHDVSIRL